MLTGGHDWTDRYPSITSAALSSVAGQPSLMVRRLCKTATALPDFDSLNSAMRWRPESIILYAFDLMHLDGKNLRQRALADRRSILSFAQKR